MFENPAKPVGEAYQACPRSEDGSGSLRRPHLPQPESSIDRPAQGRARPTQWLWPCVAYIGSLPDGHYREDNLDVTLGQWRA
jgi:hypothetical protein